MSGDVQPRKRKDKRRKKEESPDEPASHFTSDEHFHVHKDVGTGGNICSKILFFTLLAVLVGLVGLIIFEHRGAADLDIPVEKSKFASYLTDWVDESSAKHEDEHGGIEESGEIDEHEEDHEVEEQEESEEPASREALSQQEQSEEEQPEESTEAPEEEEEEDEEEEEEEEEQSQEEVTEIPGVTESTEEEIDIPGVTESTEDAEEEDEEDQSQPVSGDEEEEEEDQDVEESTEAASREADEALKKSTTPRAPTDDKHPSSEIKDFGREVDKPDSVISKAEKPATPSAKSETVRTQEPVKVVPEAGKVTTGQKPAVPPSSVPDKKPDAMPPTRSETIRTQEPVKGVPEAGKVTTGQKQAVPPSSIPDKKLDSAPPTKSETIRTQEPVKVVPDAGKVTTGQKQAVPPSSIPDKKLDATPPTRTEKIRTQEPVKVVPEAGKVTTGQKQAVPPSSVPDKKLDSAPPTKSETIRTQEPVKVVPEAVKVTTGQKQAVPPSSMPDKKLDAAPPTKTEKVQKQESAKMSEPVPKSKAQDGHKEKLEATSTSAPSEESKKGSISSEMPSRQQRDIHSGDSVTHTQQQTVPSPKVVPPPPAKFGDSGIKDKSDGLHSLDQAEYSKSDLKKDTQSSAGKNEGGVQPAIENDRRSSTVQKNAEVPTKSDRQKDGEPIKPSASEFKGVRNGKLEAPTSSHLHSVKSKESFSEQPGAAVPSSPKVSKTVTGGGNGGMSAAETVMGKGSEIPKSPELQGQATVPGAQSTGSGSNSKQSLEPQEKRSQSTLSGQNLPKDGKEKPATSDGPQLKKTNPTPQPGGVK